MPTLTLALDRLVAAQLETRSICRRLRYACAGLRHSAARSRADVAESWLILRDLNERQRHVLTEAEPLFRVIGS